ncbi:nucleoside monophosphate kinase [Patescibacteria group bacterium]|nr:nucleoside monophosphate kinase [Patescibacteria group bacterium]
MKDLVFMGIQGSGKGTQAKLLLQALPDQYAYFGTGDIFRALMGVDDAFGNHIKHRIENGLLLEDNIGNALFDGYFYTVLQTKKHMLLD